MITYEDIEAFRDANVYWDADYEKEQRDAMTVPEMVHEFATTAGQKPSASLSVQLVKEEFKEWVESLYSAPLDIRGDAAELKELADLVYVVYGYARVMGWDLDEAVRRVHENNMGRMRQPDGSIKRREDGKIIKNPDYPKVQLEDLV